MNEAKKPAMSFNSHDGPQTALADQPVVPGFTIDRQVGEGANGVVYQARQNSLNRCVALKVLKRVVPDGANADKRRSEGEAPGALQDLSIVSVFDAGLFDSPQGRRLYLAMEYIDGKPLLEYADANKLNVHERIKLIVQIAAAVGKVHSRLGKAHGDLKPQNILVVQVDGKHIPKIVDFGESWGTKEYMSPEQIGETSLGDGKPSIQSDVYTLGVLAYQLLHPQHQLPYGVDPAQKTVDEWRRVVRDKPVLALPGLPGLYSAKIQLVLGKALEKFSDPSKPTQFRFSNGSQFARYLQMAANGAYLPDLEPKTRRNRIRGFCLEHRRVTIPAAAVAAALLIGSGVATWQAIRATSWANEAETANGIAQGKATEAANNAKRANIERDHALASQRSRERAMRFLELTIFATDIYGAKGQVLDVDRMFGRAQENLNELADDEFARAIVLSMLGRAASNHGRHDQGIAWLTQSAELWKSIGAKADQFTGMLKEPFREEATARNYLAWAYLEKGDVAHAKDFAKQALTLIEQNAPAKRLDEDGLAYWADLARMQQKGGDWMGGMQEFTGMLGALSGRNEKVLPWLTGEAHSAIQLYEAGKVEDARATINAVLDEFWQRSPKRIRARLPWSVAQTGEFLSNLPLFPGFSKVELRELGLLVAQASQRLAEKILEPGHPDAVKVNALVARLQEQAAPAQNSKKQN